MKVAIILDRLNTLGGGERVLKAMLEAYPQAEIFTPTCNFKNKGVANLIKDRIIHTS